MWRKTSKKNEKQILKLSKKTLRIIYKWEKGVKDYFKVIYIDMR